MTTTTRAPFMRGDLLVLRLLPEQACMVTEDQQSGDTHVKVWRKDAPAPELLRNEDVMPISLRQDHE